MKIKPPRNVLFLCTGNACRSQMAEAIVNARLGSEWRAFSAGTHPAGSVHPKTLQVLKEIGIDHQGRSKNVEELRPLKFDVVVSVCDEAYEECPIWLGPGQHIHLSFPDPAKATGSDEEVTATFRSARNQIERQVLTLLTNLG